MQATWSNLFIVTMYSPQVQGELDLCLCTIAGEVDVCDVILTAKTMAESDESFKWMEGISRVVSFPYGTWEVMPCPSPVY